MCNMKKLLGNFAFMAIIVIILAKFSTLFTNVSFPLSIIVSDSMEPTLNKGDIVPWIPCGMEDIKRGDIIVYKSMSSWNEKKYIVHRVEKIMIRNGEKLLITKGDANNYTDQSGPHVPEPAVNQKMLEGKLIMFGGHAIKFPYAGYPWLLINKMAKKLVKPIIWRNPQSETHFVIFTPFLFFFSTFLLLIVLWLPNGKNMKERLHELIFGEARLKASQIIFYTLIMFIPFLLFTSFFSFDHAAVGEKTTNVPIFNPSMMQVRAIAFFEGDGAIPKKIFDMKSGEMELINIKNASGNIYVYSSPFWFLIPTQILKIFYNMNPKLCVAMASMLSAILMAFLTSIILIATSILWDKFVMTKAYYAFLSLNMSLKLQKFYSFHTKLKKLYNAIKMKLRGMAVWNAEMNKRAYFSFFLYIPFAFFLMDGLSNLLIICIFSSVLTGVISYFIGLKFKNEIAFLSFSASLLYSSIFAGRAITYITQDFFARFIQFFAATMLLSIILFIIMFSTMLLILYSIRIVMERFDPAALLEVGDI